MSAVVCTVRDCDSRACRTRCVWLVQVRVVFALFDANGNGEIEDSEFVDIMVNRASRGLNKVCCCRGGGGGGGDGVWGGT